MGVAWVTTIGSLKQFCWRLCSYSLSKVMNSKLFNIRGFLCCRVGETVSPVFICIHTCLLKP